LRKELACRGRRLADSIRARNTFGVVLPALERPMECCRFRVSQQVGHLSDGERRIGEMALSCLRPRLVAQHLERRAGSQQTPLQCARRRRQAARHHIDAQVAHGQLIRQNAAHTANGAAWGETLAFLQWSRSVEPALAFGLCTSVLPWLLMFPAIGYRLFGAHGPDRTRLFVSSLISHAFFGLGLWMAVHTVRLS
jgi:hypothetical protein